jgi:hypothetical protein
VTPQQYKGPTTGHDRRVILFLIDAPLLGRPARFPDQEGVSPEQQAIAAWAAAGKASVSP